MARGEFTVKARIEAEDQASGPISRVSASFRKFTDYLRNVFVVTLGDA